MNNIIDTRIVRQLFAEQVARGNHPNTNLNSVGYVGECHRMLRMNKEKIPYLHA
jgi:hypothetical protein